MGSTCRPLQLPAAANSPSPSLTCKSSGAGTRKCVSKRQEDAFSYSGRLPLQQRVNNSKPAPSAWALSPGRNSPSMCMTPPMTEASVAGGRRRGRVDGVLKYFMPQKKNPPAQEEAYHRLKVLNNRLLQWRFVNARTNASMAIKRVNAERQLICVWVRILKTRSLVVDKLILMQKLRQETKLSHIINLQMPLLTQWVAFDRKNYEALSRLNQKLQALSVQVPLVHGTKADVTCIHESMSTAMHVMHDLQESISNLLPEVEEVLHMLTKLTSTIQQEIECLQEIANNTPLVLNLMEKENSLKAHLMQTTEKTDTDGKRSAMDANRSIGILFT